MNRSRLTFTTGRGTLAFTGVAGSGTVALLGSANGDRRFLLPFIIRPVPGAAARFDAITPYGYGGVCALAADFPQPGELPAMLDAIRKWAIQQAIICFVLRLHPLLRQNLWKEELEGCKGVHISRVSQTVALDLSGWDANLDRPKGMRSDRRRCLNSARRLLRSTLTSPAAGSEHLEQARIFARGYIPAMERLGRSTFLRFSPSYFMQQSELLAENVAVQLCWEGAEPVAGASFFADACYGHYHLGALTDVGREYGAGTLSIVAGSQWIRDRGCRWFHLGGGNNRDDDKLSQFKRSFGGSPFEYVAFTFIVDAEEFARIKSLPDAGWPYR